MVLQPIDYSITNQRPFGPVNVKTDYVTGANRVDSAVWTDQRRFTAVGLIKALIRSSDARQSALLIEQIRMQLGSNLGTLVEIVDDSRELINVRGQAARLFVDMAHSVPKYGEAIDKLAQHSSALIRLGALHGFADAGDWERVRTFWADAHATVAEEAADLLAAHDDESR